MTKLSALLAGLLLAAAPALSQIAARAPLAAGSAAGAASVSFGGAVGSQMSRTLAAISLRTPSSALASLDQLRADYPKMGPVQKSAATAILAALSGGASAVPARLAQTDLPKATVARIAKIAAALDAAAAKDPAVAAKVAAGRQADDALVRQAAANPEKVLPANMVATFRAFLAWAQAPADASAAQSSPAKPSAPVVVADGKDWSKVDPKILLDPSQRPQVGYGELSVPEVAQPTLGDDISKLWTAAMSRSKSAIVAMYNFDDMDMANALVAAAKAGKKITIVGDYSNWFPERMPENIEKAKKTNTPLPQQTDAMKLIAANLGPNLQLSILKGLGSIGINHNKFTVFTDEQGNELLQSGSFNYTKTSQLNHWENVVFTRDADRLAFYKSYHAWLGRRARVYSPDLQPAEPVMDPSDPIPQDASRGVVFHGTPFPKASGSPNGGTEDWLVKAEGLVQQTLDILMFSPFPTPKMSAVIEALLDKKIPVRLVADHGQAGNAGHALIPLLKKGLQLKTIVGPDVVIQHQPYGNHSKMHEKVMIFDGRAPDAMAKMGDSLNISENALMHNFENTEFWQGFQAAFMQAHFDVMWGLAAAPTTDLLAKLQDEFDKAASSQKKA